MHNQEQEESVIGLPIRCRIILWVIHAINVDLWAEQALSIIFPLLPKSRQKTMREAIHVGRSSWAYGTVIVIQWVVIFPRAFSNSSLSLLRAKIWDSQDTTAMPWRSSSRLCWWGKGIERRGLYVSILNLTKPDRYNLIGHVTLKRSLVWVL